MEKRSNLNIFRFNKHETSVILLVSQEVDSAK